MTYPGPLTPTQPVVERPDSITHWTCPVLTEKFGSEGTNLTHNMNGYNRCKYCHHTADALRTHQAEIMAGGGMNATEMTPEFAFMCGLTLGALAQAGLMVEPEFDGDGNYLNSVRLVLPEPAPLGTIMRLTISEMTDERV